MRRSGLRTAVELSLAALAGALVLEGCATRNGNAVIASHGEGLAGFQPLTSDEGGFSVEMPAKVHERRVREGPMMASIIHAIDIDGSRYEVARFDMPEPLDEASRVALLAKVVNGLTSAPDARVVRRRVLEGAGAGAVELDLAFSGGEQGRWHIFFAGPERMFQVSVRGPAGERYTDGVVRFFGSFRLRRTDVQR